MCWPDLFIGSGMRSTGKASDERWGIGWRDEWALFPKSSLVIFVLLSVAVFGLWRYTIDNNRQRHESNTFASLMAIADLRVREVVLWRRQYTDYGVALKDNPAMGSWAAAVLNSAEGDARRQEAIDWLQSAVKQYDFQDVMLLDTNLNVVLATDTNHAAIGEKARQGLSRSLRSNDIELTDLHTAPQAPDAHMDLYVPMYEANTTGRIPVAVFLFRVDPRRTLYPMIRNWPTPSKTGESLLVRRDGDEVVFLTPLRRCDKAPLAFRKSVRTPNLPVASAVLGVRGAIKGIDAWGFPVMAASCPVPDTTWWLVVKQDRDEVMGELSIAEGLLTITGVALLNLALFVLGMSYYRQKREIILARKCAEAEKLALSQHYVNLAKYANDIILLAGEDGRVLEVNERAIRSYGYSREAILGMPLEAFWPDTHRVDYVQAIRRAEREHTVVIETMHCRADGGAFPVEVSLRFINESGLKWTQAVIRDISDRLQKRQFFDRYQALFRNARDIIMFMSRDGTILEANEAAEQAYGYQHDELLRLNLSDIRAIHTVHELEDQLAETMVKGVLRETEHRSKSGRVFPVEISARAVIIGGEPVILNIVRDISRRKAAEEAVIASERNLRQIMDLVPQAIYARNGEGRLILVNQRFAELAGKTPEELVTGAESSLADQSREADRNVLQSGQSMFIPEEMCTEEDGTVHTMQTSKTLFIPAGEDKPVLLSISTDITEGKRLEEQLIHAQRMESVGRLAGGIAHDFNNLLQAILGFNELLMSRMDAGNPGQQEAMEIDKAAKRAGVLTKQLLAYSRKQVMDLQVRDLNAIVQNASGFIKRLVGNSVQIGIVLDPKIRSIRVDVNQIEQVLMNLVMNARDAMTDGGRITICTSSVHLTNEDILYLPEANPGLFTCLAVGDTGAGISQDVLPHIFEPFYTTKGFGNGSGLGLSMVYGIVKQHGGWITVYSRPTFGTIFRMYLPVADQFPETEEFNEEPIKVPKELRESSILVVEDEDCVRQFAARALKDFGFRVFAARNVQDGLAMFDEQEGAIDLVFADVVLPDGNGVDFVRQIRSRKPEMRALLTSGYMDIQERWPEIKNRRWLFLQKPYPISTLIETMISALRALVD